MSGYEVPAPIINSPFDPPNQHWFLKSGETPALRLGRRPSLVYAPQDGSRGWDISDGALVKSKDYAPAYEIALVNRIRERLHAWRAQQWIGVTRTTLDLLQWWYRDGRAARLFFAQREAAETLIFLTEARLDFLQGINVPIDEPSEEQKSQGVKSFGRYACKMATGSGKTTVMAMIAAWSILNKVNNRGDSRFSDVALVVCPNVTIRNRLEELKPELDEASVYAKRDLVPPHLMPYLRRGRVVVTNWHVFERQSSQTGGVSAKVNRQGVPLRTKEIIRIGSKTTTARGSRYLTEMDLQRQVDMGILNVMSEERDKQGHLVKVYVESVRYVESDTAWLRRILDSEIGGKKNILIMNDEAHHAYRIKREEPDEDEEEDADEFFKEATVWIEGLDRINKHRGINMCVDLSATPYYLGRVGQDTNKPFPWVVSDFGLVDAIESGLVKIPQMAVRDTTGAEIPGYFNIWEWVLKKLTPAERGGGRASVKPEAVLKWSHTPIAMLGGLWADLRKEWAENVEDLRAPVFIIVCKNTKIAKVIFEWLAEDKRPTGIPPIGVQDFRNTETRTNTIRVDSKVVHETDTGEAKGDESRWMRFTLDTVGRTQWPLDSQSRPLYPEGFEDLAGKLKRPLHPPGRDVLCIVSVGMLTEGWDCNTVTHIIGLRPFMSQLLCEQVVGRGLRRSSYELGADGKFTEEIAKILGVPFDVIPFKTSEGGPAKPKEKRRHVHSLPEREAFRIQFPRVEGYTQAIRNRVTVDWDNEAQLILDPLNIPPEIQMKASLPTNEGRPCLSGPGALVDVTLNPYRKGKRLQEIIFELAVSLTRDYVRQPASSIPAHVLFPQLLKIVLRFVDEMLVAVTPAEKIDISISPYYGWVIERLLSAIRPDTSQGEPPEIPRYETMREPGSTDEVDFWTSRDVRETIHCHLNYVVADTKKWEQSAAYYIDTHDKVEAWVKNEGMGFSIPYFHNGQTHDYMPDFIIKLKTDPVRHLILETKGFDPLEEVKKAAAMRWVNAVNAEGSWGTWHYVIVRRPADVTMKIDEVVGSTYPPASQEVYE
jgi:type III restriction enzyme